MQIQINTDRNIEGSEGFATHFGGVLKESLSRFQDQITRLEVHISDVNGGKFGVDDKRCVIEARLAGRTPAAVSDQAGTVDQAVDGACDKLIRHLDRTLGRLDRR